MPMSEFCSILRNHSFRINIFRRKKKNAQGAAQEGWSYVIKEENSREIFSFNISEIYGYVNKRRVKAMLLLDKGCATLLCVSGSLSIRQGAITSDVLKNTGAVGMDELHYYTVSCKKSSVFA